MRKQVVAPEEPVTEDTGITTMEEPESLPGKGLKLNPAHVVRRSGRSFVLYTGLLDMGHQMGLEAIDTEILQFPTPENGQVAVCRAVAFFTREGRTRRFSGIADASPDNVSPDMVRHLIRMAETRAKARALRDGVNAGIAILGDAADEVHDPSMADPRPRMPRATPPAPRRAAPTGNAEAGTISAQQRSAIENLCRALGVDAALFAEQNAGCGLAAMSEQQAQAAIMKLNEQREQRRHAA